MSAASERIIIRELQAQNRVLQKRLHAKATLCGVQSRQLCELKASAWVFLPWRGYVS